LSEKHVAIVGTGNVLMGDDGVGPAVIEALVKEGFDGADLLDAGVALYDVLPELEGYQRVVIIDALSEGRAPGSISVARLSDIRDRGLADEMHLSLHQLSPIPALALEELSGTALGEITIVGVEPHSIEWRVGLSPALQSALARVVEAVKAEAGTNIVATMEVT